MRLSIRRKRQQQTEEYRQMQIIQDAVDDVLDNISLVCSAGGGLFCQIIRIAAGE